MRRLIALLALAIAPTLAAQDCSCLWQGSFTDVQDEADLVVAGDILGSKGNSVDLAILDTLRGTSHLAEIRIWLQARDYCRPPVEDFPPGSRWVMALQRIEQEVPGGFDPGTPNISYGRVGDYYLSSCGGYWLSLHDEHVTGALVDAPRWVREPKMTPVLYDLVAGFIAGEVDAQALRQASREDPALRELMLDTRAFLRQGGSPAPETGTDSD
ncbi:delta-aminolevulinic acid dehydratase [Mangrovimicrobium sediminis]|uniref:Delta-aminolevulinic acid dehydratase n=1 Tax=Mangrovimicrobium sediminis TaxID=2562682 RepID=A0A4Z0LZ03_9GAMM|nr:delta-aminolevulinic acid dehydratase [Haliea sp. SAOS-164]TGD72444.1 delta-aminolevulinic acid dehydratase [Haliea sp. SAOS-164]